MATLAETMSETTVRTESVPQPNPAGTGSAVLLPWLRAQSINVTRHAAALRPFRREEFGTGAASPSEGHIQVVNKLISTLRRGLLKMSRKVTTASGQASAEPSSAHLQRVVVNKDNAQKWVQGIEKIWD